MSPPSAAEPPLQPTVEQLEPSPEAASAPTPPPAKARRREGATTEGKTEGKKSKLARGPKVSPNALEATLTREAFSAYLHGDLEHAYGLYRRAVHEFPAAAEAWRGLGLVATRLGRFDEARRALGRYLTLSPAAVDAAAIAEHRSKLP